MSKEITLEECLHWIRKACFICVMLLLGLNILQITTIANDTFSQFVTYSIYYALPVMIILTAATIILSFIRKCTDHTTSRLYALFGLLLGLAIIVLSYVATRQGCMMNPTWILLITAFACEDQEEDRILNAALRVAIPITVIIFFMSLLGLINNNRGTGFGFVFRTHYASFLLTLAMAYCYVKDGRLPFYGEIGLVGLLLFVCFVVKGKSVTVCLFLLIMTTLLRHYHREGKVPYQDPERYGLVTRCLFQALYLPVKAFDWCSQRIRLGRMKPLSVKVMAFSFCIFGLIMILLTRLYRQIDWLKIIFSRIQTVASRLIMGAITFEEYPLNLFGSIIPQLGWSGSSGGYVDFYYALDSAYIKGLLQYGVPVFVLLMAFMTMIQFRLYRRRRYYAMMLLTCFALDGMMNYWMLGRSHNWFVLLCFCKMKRAEEIEEGHSMPQPRPGSHGRFLKPVVVLCMAVVGLWCFTAYPITAGYGSEVMPNRNATIVVSDGIEGGAGNDQLVYEKLERTASYLGAYKESCCIVSGNSQTADDMVDILEDIGVEKSRIYRDPDSRSVDDMLTNSRKIIRENHLPPRLTIGTFDMYQARIKRHSQALHIPCNSLVVKMPGQFYFQNFLIEQWKVLFEK